MENFAGRDSKLDFLERQYDRTGSQLIVVYGNKGVGKTRLLQEFCGDREWKYYLARACSEKEQRYQWSCEQGEAFPFLEEPLSYVMLVLVTSASGWVENSFVGKIGRLFRKSAERGRTGEIKPVEPVFAIKELKLWEKIYL